MNKLDLIGYTQSFVSFVLPRLRDFTIKEVILFGSAARGEATSKSDVDIFIDIENEKDAKRIESVIKKEEKKFYKSKIAEMWQFKGIKNEIKINAGVLEQWKLKRSIMSDGIVLYGRYKELPKDLKQYTLFVFEPIKNCAKRNRFIRALTGRREKAFKRAGLLEKLKGKKLSSRAIVVPTVSYDQAIKLFNKEKINYRIFELWSDQFNSK